MQSGYSIGYLLAAVAMESVLPHLGWRAMFCVGFVIAILISMLALRAPGVERLAATPSALDRQIGRTFRILWENRKGFAYLLLVMTVMSCLSHGTQDLYPDFLKSAHGFARLTVSKIAILYNICAIASFTFFGQLSESLGRRDTIMLALGVLAPGVSAVALYPWAFGIASITLVLRACLMQTGVQGTFGIIPAHLNELTSNAVRNLFPRGSCTHWEFSLLPPLYPSSTLCRNIWIIPGR